MTATCTEVKCFECACVLVDSDARVETDGVVRCLACAFILN